MALQNLDSVSDHRLVSSSSPVPSSTGSEDQDLDLDQGQGVGGFRAGVDGASGRRRSYD